MRRPRQKGEDAELKVFIDSSVFFAAVLSGKGGSFRVFREARKRNIVLIVTPYVTHEVEKGLEERYPTMVESFHSFFLHFPLVIAVNPPERFIRRYVHLIPSEDVPILAAAIFHKTTHLLTLDRRHFLLPLKKVSLPVKIVAPGDFIQKYFV